MKSSSWLSAVTSAVLVSGLMVSAANANRAAESVPGEILVGMKQGLAPIDSKRVLESALTQVLGNDAVVSVTPLQMDESIQKIVLKDPTKRSAAISQLRHSLIDSVEYAEPNYLYRAIGSVESLVDGEPNDADFAKQWDMLNTGQIDKPGGKLGTPGSDINVVPLWKQGVTGSRNILVAVIDTGVDYNHSQLAANTFKNTKEIAGNGIDDDQNGVIDDVYGANFVSGRGVGNGLDDHNHGTHCAGTIGARGNDGEGISGVNWEATILPVKFLSSSGSGSSEGAVNSIKYATKMGAKIMSNSWGGGGFSEAMKRAIEEAKDAGVLFVAAAGNDGGNNDEDPHYPSNYDVPNVVSVAATDNNDALASFSNYGSRTVHVAAPGVSILSTVRNGGYAIYSGTSMATPHVSGIAALIWGANPEWTFADVKKRLIETSIPVQNLRRKTVSRGRVDAYNAFHGIITPGDDPADSAWKTMDYSLESAHPYTAGTNETFEVNVPGAKYIRIVFEKFETEKSYDTLTLLSPEGTVLETLSGTLGAGYVTEYVKADRLTLRLKSDASVQGFGFKVSKIQIVE